MLTQSFYQPSRSLADRLFTAEFDDALVDQLFWKNPRYDGSKLTAKKINHYHPIETTQAGIGLSSISDNSEEAGGGGFQVGIFPPIINWPGDSIHPGGLNPLLKNETTALYIANTVIGGDEDPQFATIKRHSYVNINQIILIHPSTDATQVLDRTAEQFDAFQRFITTDLPTGGNFSIKLIDESISHNLKGPNQYKVKMNKGLLLKSFDFKMAPSAPQLTENNSMYLWKGGSTRSNLYEEGVPTALVASTLSVGVSNGDFVRFRYGVVEMIGGSSTNQGHTFARDRIGPSFISSSIIQNKFTEQYYTGSFGFINEPPQPQGTTNRDLIRSTGLGSASRFIGMNSLKFLRDNNNDTSLTRQEKTELHVTFFEGTKDFSLNSPHITSSANDERSIGTFEIDHNQDDLDAGGLCHDFLPKTHEIRLKGRNDDRFEPKINPITDDILNGYVTHSTTVGGCVPIDTFTPPQENNYLQLGINVDKVDTASIYIQGGILGEIGYDGALSASHVNYGGNNPDKTLLTEMSSSNFYSGSFRYELSWLDKDHTLISNVDKELELFDGIGVKGIVIIPEYIHPKIKNNINYYLQQAGIIDSSPSTLTELTAD
tara:strand:- start:2421 stop:4223 length:1803 start_codon:yes stop_codon:yes gene_type:complete